MPLESTIVFSVLDYLYYILKIDPYYGFVKTAIILLTLRDVNSPVQPLLRYKEAGIKLKAYS